MKLYKAITETASVYYIAAPSLIEAKAKFSRTQEWNGVTTFELVSEDII